MTSPATGDLATGDSLPLVKVATSGGTTYWQMPAGVDSFTKLTISVPLHVAANGQGTRSMIVSDVSSNDTLGGIGSHTQLVRTIDERSYLTDRRGAAPLQRRHTDSRLSPSLR